MICNNCGHNNPAKARFCVSCGNLLGNICPGCGADNNLEAQYCVRCGTKLKDASEISRLVALAKLKDEAAIARLFDMTKRRYMLTCRQILTKTRTSGEIEDVLQDAYVKIFSRLESLQQPEKFISWGERIAANTALDQLRKISPVLMDSEADLDAAGYEPVHESILSTRDPGQVMDERETSRLVSEIVEGLPGPQRLCIYLFYMKEMQVKDIAEHLGVSENTVKSRLKYGRSNIEKKVLLLEKQGTKLYGFAPMPFFIWLFRKVMADYEGGMDVSASLRAAVLHDVASTGAKAAAGGTTAGKTGSMIGKRDGGKAGFAARKTGTGKAAGETVRKAILKNAAGKSAGSSVAGAGSAAGGVTAGSAISETAAAGGAASGSVAAGSTFAVKAAALIAAGALVIGSGTALIRSLNRSDPTKAGQQSLSRYEQALSDDHYDQTDVDKRKEDSNISETYTSAQEEEQVTQGEIIYEDDGNAIPTHIEIEKTDIDETTMKTIETLGFSYIGGTSVDFTYTSASLDTEDYSDLKQYPYGVFGFAYSDIDHDQTDELILVELDSSDNLNILLFENTDDQWVKSSDFSINMTLKNCIPYADIVLTSDGRIMIQAASAVIGNDFLYDILAHHIVLTYEDGDIVEERPTMDFETTEEFDDALENGITIGKILVPHFYAGSPSKNNDRKKNGQILLSALGQIQTSLCFGDAQSAVDINIPDYVFQYLAVLSGEYANTLGMIKEFSLVYLTDNDVPELIVHLAEEKKYSDHQILVLSPDYADKYDDLNPLGNITTDWKRFGYNEDTKCFIIEGGSLSLGVQPASLGTKIVSLVPEDVDVYIDEDYAFYERKNVIGRRKWFEPKEQTEMRKGVSTNESYCKIDVTGGHISRLHDQANVFVETENLKYLDSNDDKYLFDSAVSLGTIQDPIRGSVEDMGGVITAEEYNKMKASWIGDIKPQHFEFVENTVENRLQYIIENSALK